MGNTYTVKLDVFEGPLDLLLELIEKDKLDISNISLAKIADAFINHVRDIGEKEPGYLTGFLVIAAKLILIKSKTLLPSFDVSDEEEQEIGELKEKLAHYQKVRIQAREIWLLSKNKDISYHRHSGLKAVQVFLPPVKMTTEILANLYYAVKDTCTMPDVMPVKLIDPILSFEESLHKIRERIKNCAHVHFHEMQDVQSKAHLIVSFLAILELARQRFLSVQQDKVFGEIKIIQV